MKQEVANAMRCAGQYPTPDQIEKLIKGPGGGGKGGINLKQFMAMLKQHASENSDWQEELLEVCHDFVHKGILVTVISVLPLEYGCLPPFNLPPVC